MLVKQHRGRLEWEVVVEGNKRRGPECATLAHRGLFLTHPDSATSSKSILGMGLGMGKTQGPGCVGARTFRRWIMPLL